MPEEPSKPRIVKARVVKKIVDPVQQDDAAAQPDSTPATTPKPQGTDKPADSQPTTEPRSEKPPNPTTDNSVRVVASKPVSAKQVAPKQVAPKPVVPDTAKSPFLVPDRARWVMWPFVAAEFVNNFTDRIRGLAKGSSISPCDNGTTRHNTILNSTLRTER